nr:GNAT family N-acetyltransferase [Steroidobacteraceae bacterium]
MSAAAGAGPHTRPRLVRFRAMTPADLPAVAGVERAAYPFPWSEGIFRDCLRVGYLCRVAELDGEIVGYGIVAMGAGESHLLNLCVRRDVRNRGVGRRMLRLCIERARQAGM